MKNISIIGSKNSPIIAALAVLVCLEGRASEIAIIQEEERDILFSCKYEIKALPPLPDIALPIMSNMRGVIPDKYQHKRRR